jgi:hypothetical protein
MGIVAQIHEPLPGLFVRGLSDQKTLSFPKTMVPVLPVITMMQRAAQPDSHRARVSWTQAQMLGIEEQKPNDKDIVECHARQAELLRGTSS